MALSADVEIQNKYGFHARPSTSFSAMAGTFDAAISVTVDGTTVDGKSVMGLMSLGAPQGTIITIATDGADEEKALSALKAHVEDRFGGIE